MSASVLIVGAGVNTRVTEVVAGSANTPVMVTAMDIVGVVIEIAHMAHGTGGAAIRVIAMVNRLGP